MWRLTVLLKRRSGLQRAEFLDYWQRKHIPLVLGQASLRPLIRRYVADLPFAQGQEDVPDLENGFPDVYDGAAELWFDGREELRRALADPALNAIARRDAEQFAELDEAVVAAGEVREWLESGPLGVKMMIYGRARPGLSREDAQDYWGKTHPLVGQSAKNFWRQLTLYRQVHLRSLDELPAGKLPPFDMAADVGAPSAEILSQAFSHPEYLEIVRPDEKKFADLTSAIAYLAAKEVVFTPK